MEGGRHSLIERMKAAARLRPWVYEEVEADPGATGQAAIVVGLVAIASAIGGAGGGTIGIVGGLASAYLGWLLWSAVTYAIGDWVLQGTATWGEVLRTIGFALSPGVLLVFSIVPLLGWIVDFIVFFWVLLAVVVAVRQALDFGTGRAVLTAVLGWIPYVILRAVTSWITGVRPDLF